MFAPARVPSLWLVPYRFEIACLLLLLGFPSSELDAQVSITGMVPVTVLTSPLAVTVVDVDTDGERDLAVSHMLSDQISLWSGDGTGGFLYASTLTVSIAPTVLLSADVDGDDREDIIGHTPLAQQISIVHGDLSTGGTETLVDVAATIRQVLVDDVDGDGDLDLVVLAAPVSFGANDSVRLYHGDGTAHFTFQSEIPLDGTAGAIAFGDFNRDEIRDLVVATNATLSGPPEIAVAYGDGYGYQPFVTYRTLADSPLSLAVADWDRDGYCDVAVSIGESFACGPVVEVYRNDGSGALTLQQSVDLGCGPFAVIAADVDNDGWNDLVLSSGGTVLQSFEEVWVAIGMSGGDFATPELAIASGPWELGGPVLDDIDHDGLDDFVLVSHTSDQVFVYLNQSLPEVFFVRGDANRDHVVDITDAIYTLAYLFQSGGLECADAADVDDSGAIEVTDVVYLIYALVLPGSPPIPAPWPELGIDSTEDELRCD